MGECLLAPLFLTQQNHLWITLTSPQAPNNFLKYLLIKKHCARNSVPLDNLEKEYISNQDSNDRNNFVKKKKKIKTAGSKRFLRFFQTDCLNEEHFNQ